MSRVPEHQPRTGGQDFREAVAQWRLQVHTEVKRDSSLPTAMFDAVDPMLEMQLAETTEAMLALLHRPSAGVAAAAEGGKRRLEQVDDSELRRLAAQIAERPECELDLLRNLGREYLAILADACCGENRAVRERAAGQLCRDFGLTRAGLDEIFLDLEPTADEAGLKADARDDFDRALLQVRDELLAHLEATTGDGTP